MEQPGSRPSAAPRGQLILRQAPRRRHARGQRRTIGRQSKRALGRRLLSLLLSLGKGEWGCQLWSETGLARPGRDFESDRSPSQPRTYLPTYVYFVDVLRTSYLHTSRYVHIKYEDTCPPPSSVRDDDKRQEGVVGCISPSSAFIIGTPRPPPLPPNTFLQTEIGPHKVTRSLPPCRVAVVSRARMPQSGPVSLRKHPAEPALLVPLGSSAAHSSLLAKSTVGSEPLTSTKYRTPNGV